MTKRLFIPCFIILSSFLFRATAQDLRVKKGQITKNGEPYALFDGKVGVLRTRATVSALNGDSLFSIRHWKYPGKNLQYDLLRGYKVTFIPTGDTAIRISNAVLISKEHLLDFIFQNRDFNSTSRENEFRKDLITGNTLNMPVVNEYLETLNGVKYLHSIDSFQLVERQFIKDQFPVVRDKTQPVIIKSVDAHTSDVFQDGEKIITIYKKPPFTGSTYRYTFYRKLDHPIEVGDQEYDCITIATAVLDNFPKLYINAQDKLSYIEVTSPTHAERQIIDLLINDNAL